MERAPEPRVPADVFRRLTFHSILGGLCPLIPVPFMDDWALAQVQRRAVAEMGRAGGLELTDREVRLLAGAEDADNRGCVGTVVWAVRQVIGAILGKLYRSVLYFLTIRRSVHRSAETLNLGHLVLHAARLGKLPPTGRSEEQVRAVRAAILSTQKELDARPIHKVLTRDFRQSLSLLLRVAAFLGQFVPRRKRRRPPAETLEGGGEAYREAEGLLGGFVDRLAADLRENREYFADLDRTFERQLG